MRFSVAAAFTTLLGLAAASPVAMIQARATDVVTLPSTNGTCTNGPTQQYTVVQGDTLTSIAQAFKSGICDIFEASIPLGITNPNFLSVGEKLNVPTNVCSPDNTSCLTEKEGTRTCLPGGPGSYTIVAGDTVFLIGSTARFNLTIASILAANPGLDPNNLQIGQVIKLPVC